MPEQAIDYAALAKQAGATTPAPSADVDYAALAKAAGAVSSAPAPGPSVGTWEDRGVAGKVWHPATGATERGREDNSLVGMPPEFAALSGLAIARAVGAPALTAAARAVAGIKATVGQALPAVKYEVTKTTLEKLGVPSAVAIPIAMAVSSYKRGGKAEAAAKAGPPSDVSPPGVDRYMPNVSGASSTPIVAEAAPAVAEAAAPAATEFQAAQAARQANSLPDQKALNEAAIAARRAAYQARQAATPAAADPIVAASGKMKLTGPEMVEFNRLRKSGLSLADAYAKLQDMRELAARFGSPTAADVQQAIAARRTKYKS